MTTALAFAEKAERGKVAKSAKAKLWGNEVRHIFFVRALLILHNYDIVVTHNALQKMK